MKIFNRKFSKDLTGISPEKRGMYKNVMKNDRKGKGFIDKRGVTTYVRRNASDIIRALGSIFRRDAKQCRYITENNVSNPLRLSATSEQLRNTTEQSRNTTELFRELPKYLRGFPGLLRGFPELPGGLSRLLRGFPELPRCTPDVVRGLPEFPRGFPELPRGFPGFIRSSPVKLSRVPEHYRGTSEFINT